MKSSGQTLKLWGGRCVLALIAGCMCCNAVGCKRRDPEAAQALAPPPPVESYEYEPIDWFAPPRADSAQAVEPPRSSDASSSQAQPRLLSRNRGSSNDPSGQQAPPAAAPAAVQAESGDAAPTTHAPPPRASQPRGPIEGFVDPGVEVTEAGLPDNWDKPVNIPLGDPARDLIGVWRQDGGPLTADYAIGGYTSNVLIFTGTARVYTIRRVADQFKATTVTPFTIKDDRLVLERGDGDGASPIVKPMAIGLPGGGSTTVHPPNRKLPAELEYTLTGDVLTIGAKTFKRRRQ